MPHWYNHLTDISKRRKIMTARFLTVCLLTVLTSRAFGQGPFGIRTFSSALKSIAKALDIPTNMKLTETTEEVILDFPSF